MGNHRNLRAKKQAESPDDEIESSPDDQFIGDSLLIPVEKPQFQPRPSRLDPTGIYSEQDLVHNFEMRPTFFRDAREGRLDKQRAGTLRRLEPLDLPSRNFFYLGDEVLKFFVLMSRPNHCQ